jgi:hypothetical protein
VAAHQQRRRPAHPFGVVGRAGHVGHRRQPVLVDVVEIDLVVPHQPRAEEGAVERGHAVVVAGDEAAVGQRVAGAREHVVAEPRRQVEHPRGIGHQRAVARERPRPPVRGGARGRGEHPGHGSNGGDGGPGPDEGATGVAHGAHTTAARAGARSRAGKRSVNSVSSAPAQLVHARGGLVAGVAGAEGGERARLRLVRAGPLRRPVHRAQVGGRRRARGRWRSGSRHAALSGRGALGYQAKLDSRRSAMPDRTPTPAARTPG